jgi:hypothetical protein
MEPRAISPGRLGMDRGKHGLLIGFLVLALLTGSLLPLVPFVLLGGLVAAAQLRRPGGARWDALVFLGTVVLVGALAWQGWEGSSVGMPGTRIGVTEAYARALVEADWERASALMTPRARADWGSLFLLTGERLHDQGVRVVLCEDAQLWMECRLEGGERYLGGLMVFLERTDEGWQVDGFLELGGPLSPDPAGEGGG